jgi:hypothetical protein
MFGRQPHTRPPTRVNVCWRRHTRCEVSFHKLHRVFLSSDDRGRSNFGDAMSVGRSSLLVLDRHQPHFAERFKHRAARPLICLRRGTSWI